MRSLLATVLMAGLLASAPELLAEGASKEKDEAARKEMARLEGTWQLVSAEKGGKKLPAEQAKQIRIVIKGGKHTVYFGTKAIAKDIAFRIDPTTSPKRAEDTLEDGKKIRSIYELDGDTLRSCVAPIGKAWPTEFSGKKENTLRVFKRAKR